VWTGSIRTRGEGSMDEEVEKTKREGDEHGRKGEREEERREKRGNREGETHRC